MKALGKAMLAAEDAGKIHPSALLALRLFALGNGYQKRSMTERYIHSSLEALGPAADAIAGALAKRLGLLETGRLLAFKT